MSKIKTIAYEHFELAKFKISENKNVEISYFNLLDRETSENPKSNHYTHQKLFDMLDEFKPMFAEASGHLRGWNFAREALRGNLEQLELAIKGFNEEVENHNVTGVSFIGDKMKGIQISGSFKTLLGSTGYAAPKVYFESDKISYGAEAEELLEKLRARVYAYLFQGEHGAKKKKAEAEVDPNQTTILDEDQQKVAAQTATEGKPETNPKKKK